MPFPEPKLPSLAPKTPHRIKVRYSADSSIKEYSTQEFEALFGIGYLFNLSFASKKIYDAVQKLCTQAIRNKEVNPRAERMGVYYRREVKAGTVGDVCIQWVNERVGYGLFAAADIEEGGFIGQYVGIVRRCSRLFGNVNEYCFRYPLKRFSLFVYTIDANRNGNETRFINHNRENPNCDAVVTVNNDLLHICIYANRMIKEGEELSFDYGNKRD